MGGFAKKVLDPRSLLNNPAGKLLHYDPAGDWLAKGRFDSKGTGFGGRTGDWFTKKRAQLTGAALLKSRGVNADGSANPGALDASGNRLFSGARVRSL